MKKLQNNFTTQEQSKYLLELGLPADSADCYYTNIIPHSKREDYSTLYILPFGSGSSISSLKEIAEKEGGFIIPCWSAGRLIEIYEACCLKRIMIHFEKCKYVHEQIQNLIEDLIGCIERTKIMSELYPHLYKIDFSKLEE